MSTHRYPKSSLIFDGLRSAIGLTATFGTLAFLEVVWPLALVLLILGLIFLAFASRLVTQSLSLVELSDGGISSRGVVDRTLAWSEMTSLKLAHYAVPRRPTEGWYQLTIKGENFVLKVDSTIEGFGDIVGAAIRAADATGLDLDLTTGENLKGFKHSSDQRISVG